MRAKRAGLGAIAGFVDQGSRVLVGFIVAPILVASLGAAGFGIWQILFKLHAQLGPLDGRAPEALKWTIANQQASDGEVQRGAMGSSVIALFVFLPVLLFAYILVYIYLPDYLSLQGSELQSARLALVLLGFATVFLSIGQIFESAVRGMNLAYKLLGVKGALVILGGALTAGFAYLGLGLEWIALSQLLVAIVGIPLLWLIAKKNVRWLGFSKPASGAVVSFIHRSKWFMASELISLWMLAGEVVLLGALVSAEIVSSYVLTMFAAQMITVAVITGVSSALPGLGGLVGSGELLKADKVRKESLLYSWMLALAICCVVLVFNRSFVSLWVGPEYYAGKTVNFLIVLCTLQLIFIRHDAAILNIALNVKGKVLWGLLSALLTFPLILFYVPRQELLGLCMALLAGRILLSISYPLLVAKLFNQAVFSQFPARQLLITIVLLFLCWRNSELVSVSNWVNLLLQVSLFGLIILLLVFGLGINREQRLQFYARCNSILSRV